LSHDGRQRRLSEPRSDRGIQNAGPAWLAAFLPSAGGWSTAGAIRAQLLDANQQAETGTDTAEAYLQKFPGAAVRIERRGGGTTMMPNLPLSKDEIGQSIAYLKYTSAMDTEGWPPAVEVKGGLGHRLRLGHSPAATAPSPVAAAAASTLTTATTPPAKPTADLAAVGAQPVEDNGCLACHAVDTKRLVGPGWGGLYNSQVKLTTGETVTADDAYLRQSILKPNAKIVTGYQPDMMPDYSQIFTEDQINAVVSYLQILGKK
jgi:cytochrome c551/c552